MINYFKNLMSSCQFFTAGIVFAIFHNIALIHNDGKILQNRN